MFQLNGEDVICREKDGDRLRILDASGSRAFDVSLGDHQDEKRIQSRLNEFFSRPIDPKHEPFVTIQVDAQLDSVHREEIRKCIVVLFDLLKSNTRLNVTFHFRQPSPDWSETISSIEKLNEALSNNLQASIRLSGEFDELDEGTMDEMFRLGVQLRYATGYGAAGPSVDSIVVKKSAIARLSEFGYQVPMVIYAGHGNLKKIEQSIAEMLLVNHYGGFSVPLVSRHPSYEFSESDPGLPDTRDYCELLVRLYKKYSHFDAGLAPVSELAMLAKHGGRNRALDLPTILPIHLNTAGVVGIYRQTPSRSLPWKNVSEIAECDEAALPNLRQDLRQFLKNSFDWSRNSYCGECQWRGICGGIDHFGDSNGLPNDVYDVMCDHRMLLLEHFVSERIADFQL